MKKPTLVVMAAGMGSRYGGLKQMDPMDEYGHLIMDFSVYDAVQAGFGRVVFIIKKENLQDFRDRIGRRLEQYVEVEYAFQTMELPKGYELPEGRTKPFGTGHAVLCAAPLLDGPFAVINADDYYGKQAFESICGFLTTSQDDEKYHFAMAGYMLENTLTESGSVARGVCELKEPEGTAAGTGRFLAGITERTCIERRGDGAAYSEDGGATWVPIPKGSTVSMNMWGFSAGILPELEKRFHRFLEEDLKANPLKSEFFLPFAVNELLEEGKADVLVLPTRDRWYGVTYREDKDQVVSALRRMNEQGLYPWGLWKTGIKDLVRATRSCRGYDESRKVTKEELLDLVDCARLTASSVNQQPLRYYLAWESGKVAAIQKLTTWAKGLPELTLPHEGKYPPAFIVICQDTRVWEGLARFQKDAGIAAWTMLLAATERGLGGCMIGSFQAGELKKELGLAEYLTPLLVVAIGKPDEKIVIKEIGPDEPTGYYRDENDVHYVPKRRLEDLIINGGN